MQSFLMEKEEEEEIVYPEIVFDVGGSLYCVNSRYISTIMQVPAYESVPAAPPEITGAFSHQGSTVTMLDFRRILHMNSLEDEYHAFCDMLDARKGDHIHWVEELERTVHEEEPFTLATDAHQCALGKWYYAFHSDNQEVMFHLHKIEEPHNKLHQAALEVKKCSQDCANCQRKECLKKILDRVRNECMPKILSLLEDTKEIFRSRIYHEMALVLNVDQYYGLIVDQVLSVENLIPVGDEAITAQVLGSTRFISRVLKSEKKPDMILELDIPNLLATIPSNFEGAAVEAK